MPWVLCSQRQIHPFFYTHKGNSTLFVLAYVDDLIVTGPNGNDIQRFIDGLRQKFSLKDLGTLHYFLGMEVSHTSEGLHLSQNKYIQGILEKANMIAAKGLSSPMVSSPGLSKHQGNPTVDGTLYRSIVGALQYATLTRPDITFSVNKVSQFMQTPLDTHWKAVKRILRYLASTLDHGLHIRASDKIFLTAYCDSDWAADLDDRRSVSGYCIFLGKSLVSWSSKKQHVVSR